ncbi:IS66 family transposase [Azohydromonas australica]|uniref:IS66 family transposase n=1 Tax=Azohydromonas australica TaxID=364039 RepID=UPI002873D2C8|nr:IS66 family transposase [Azohydromonas australica]
MRDLTAKDLQGLTPEAMAALAQQMLQHIEQQAREIALKQEQIELKEQQIQRQARDIVWRDAKIEKINFELARLKRWRFGAKTEAMDAQQRQMFEDTMVEDEASLEAQLAALRAARPETPESPTPPPRRPRRQALPEHLRRVEHRHEPEDTHCPTLSCRRPMTRVGEDVSEKLDIVPAEFFVHRHVYGKWVCRCCERLVQEPAEPEIIDGGMPASGLVAHTMISHFVDHLPYYRLEAINARSRVHTPRSTLAAWSGRGGAALEPLYELHKRFVLSCAVLHADETPVAMLDPGAGKTKKTYIWAYARGALDAQRGMVYDFCLGRGGQYPVAFLNGKVDPDPPTEPDGDKPKPWQGTLVSDRYVGYDPVLDPKIYPERVAAACAAHARRKFDELANAGASNVAEEAIEYFARIYHVEGRLGSLAPDERLAMRQALARPIWDELDKWLKLQRKLVPDGGTTANAIDYSLNNWEALTRNLQDGTVPLDNNHLEQQIKPWKVGAKNWLFLGSELAGKRAAMVMSLVQSAKLNGHDPWAYLRDVLARLPTHLNNRLEELLPHRWQPAAAG